MESQEVAKILYVLYMVSPCFTGYVAIVQNKNQGENPQEVDISRMCVPILVHFIICVGLYNHYCSQDIESVYYQCTNFATPLFPQNL